MWLFFVPAQDSNFLSRFSSKTTQILLKKFSLFKISLKNFPYSKIQPWISLIQDFTQSNFSSSKSPRTTSHRRRRTPSQFHRNSNIYSKQVVNSLRFSFFLHSPSSLLNSLVFLLLCLLIPNCHESYFLCCLQLPAKSTQIYLLIYVVFLVVSVYNLFAFPSCTNNGPSLLSASTSKFAFCAILFRCFFSL